jgi:hypothetical protein
MSKFAQEKQLAIASSRHNSPDALLNAFHSAAMATDLNAYFGCFHQTSRFLGTDASENWTVEEFYDFSRPYFKAGHGWSYNLVAGTRKFVHFPSKVEAESMFCTFDEVLLNDGFGTCRGSGTLVFDSSSKSWFIAQYHLTFPVPNDLAEDVTKLISAKDVNLQQAKADQAAAELLKELELEDSTTQNPKNSQKKKKNKK